MIETMKLIISQRYVKKNSGSVASLVDFQGKNVLVKSDNGTFETISVDTFKNLYMLAAA